MEKCLSAKLVPANEGWALPLVRLDTVVGSGLPQCCYCGQARPLHYPGDCKNALYEADQMPCLVCGSEGHIPEECPIPGTSVVGHATALTMLEAYLTKYQNRGQCYICKAYHLQDRKYGQQHFTSKKCLHSLLARGSLRCDREESLLQRSKDHRRLLNIPKPKRQRGLDCRPIVIKTPEQQWTVKALDKTFKRLQDQRSVPLVFQLTRYLAKKGLGPLNGGESQTLEGFIQADQRDQSMNWIRDRKVECQRAFEAADDQLYGRNDEDTDPEERSRDPPNANQRPPKRASASSTKPH